MSDSEDLIDAAVGDAPREGSVGDESVDIPSDLSLESLEIDDDCDGPESSESSDDADDESGSLSSEEEENSEEADSSDVEENSEESDSNESGLGEASYEDQELDSDHVLNLSEDDSADDLPFIIKRRKRGRFKKGFLKPISRKGAKAVSRSGTGSGSQSEGYTDEMEQLLHSELDEAGEESHYSVAETVPSEGDSGAGTQDVSENEEETNTLEPPKKKKRKNILGIKKKRHYPKSTNVSSEMAANTEQPSSSSKPPKEDQPKEDQPKDPKKILTDFLKAHLQNLTHKQPAAHESLQVISDYLKLTLLDNSWSVSISDGVLCLCRIVRPDNPFVKRAITWDGSKIKFLVHNVQLPPRHILWRLKKPDVHNFGAVADYLTNMSRYFLDYEVCSGVQSFSELWPSFSEKGHKEENIYNPSLRSKDCTMILVYPGKCRSCLQLAKSLREKMRQINRNATASGQGDANKINNRYLKMEDLQKRMEKLQYENKLSKQTIRRLRQRVDIMLKTQSEQIDSELGNDFVQIMNENTSKMSALEKIFWEQQSKAIQKRGKSKSMLWHPAMIRLALHLRSLSPAAYDFVRGIGIISLPCQRRLFDYSQFTDVKEGISKDLQEEFKKIIEEKCLDEASQYFIMLLDEMSIKSELVYNSRTGELVGYTNLTSLEEELSRLEAEVNGKDPEKRLAKKVLVFMLNGAITPISFIAAVYATDDLTSYQLYARAWDVIYFAEDAGAKVLAVIFDGASVNRKFIQMHFNAGDTNYVHCTLNPASGNMRPIYFMLDTPHLLKTFRNCLANSCSHRNSRNLCNNNQDLSWKAIEGLYEILQKNKYKSTKLTKAHIHLTSFSCMKVFLAVQVLSLSVAEALEKYKDISPLREHYSEELVKFIKTMNKCFDCLNGGSSSEKKKENPDLLEYTSEADPRFDFLQYDVLKYLEDWESFVKSREGNYTKDQRSRMTISYQSLEGMKITINSFIKMTRFLLAKGAPSISARQFNQDALEQFFANMRRAGGSDNNPTVKQVLHSRLTFHVVGQQMSAASKKGNTESLKRSLEPDASPLLSRKKPKK